MALLEILGRGFQRAAKIPAREMRMTPCRKGVGGPLQAQSCAEGAVPKICVPFCVSGLVSRYAGREIDWSKNRSADEGSLFQVAKTNPDQIARIVLEIVGLARNPNIRNALTQGD